MRATPPSANTSSPRHRRRVGLAVAVTLALFMALTATEAGAADPPAPGDFTANATGDPAGYWLLGANGTVYACGNPDAPCSNGPSGSVAHFGGAFDTAAASLPGNPIPDDFNTTSLNDALWIERGNALGGASYAYPANHAQLTAPAGPNSYHPWTEGNRAPTLRQEVANGDLDLVAVFASMPSQKFQMQGVVLADASNLFLRFDVYWNGTEMRAFAADPSVSTTPLIDVAVPSNAHAKFIRVLRTGNTWELRTSADGSTWTSHGTFSRAITVTGMGPFIGNARADGTSDAPAHTGLIDYFGTLPIPTGAIGGGAPPATGAQGVAMTPTATSGGYVILTSDGAVVARGDAVWYGDLRDAGPAATLSAGERGTAISLTTTGMGYWIFTNLGRAVPFGDAVHYGDLPGLAIVPDQDVVASAAIAGGYFMLGGDGGVFTFGTATFAGSIPEILPGVTLDCEIVGLVPTPSGNGYWLVACDGGVFAFGDAGFVGSVPGALPGVTLDAPVNGMVANGGGYLMVASDGGVFTFGAPFFGSLGGAPLPTTIVAIAPGLAA